MRCKRGKKPQNKTNRVLRLGGSTGPQSPCQCVSPHLGVLLPHPSFFLPVSPGRGTSPPSSYSEGNEFSNGLLSSPEDSSQRKGDRPERSHTWALDDFPGQWWLWGVAPRSSGCAIIFSQAKGPLSSYSTAQVLAFLGCGNLFFQVVHPHIEQDLTKTVGASWLLAALAGTQQTADDLIHAW